MKKITIAIVTFFTPFIAYGQLSEIKNVNNLATRLAGIGNIITYLLVGLAVIYIIWNIVHYFIRPSGEDRKDAGMNILWGIVGLFIIVSLWGIVNILVNTFYTDPNVPKNRFPTADFTNRNNQSNNFVSQPDVDIRDVPAGDSSVINTNKVNSSQSTVDIRDFPAWDSSPSR